MTVLPPGEDALDLLYTEAAGGGGGGTAYTGGGGGGGGAGASAGGAGGGGGGGSGFLSSIIIFFSSTSSLTTSAFCASILYVVLSSRCMLVQAGARRHDGQLTLFVVLADLDDLIDMLLLESSFDNNEVLLFNVRNATVILVKPAYLLLEWVAELNDSLLVYKTLWHPCSSFLANLAYR